MKALRNTFIIGTSIIVGQLIAADLSYKLYGELSLSRPIAIPIIVALALIMALVFDFFEVRQANASMARLSHYIERRDAKFAAIDHELYAEAYIANYEACRSTLEGRGEL